MSFVNKVVLVTGASSGIGAVTAIAFAKEGASVAIIGRKEDKLKEVAEKCEDVGPKALIIKADISVDDDAKRVVEDVIKNFGKLDVLVNNAGLTCFGSILEGNLLNAYDDTMKVNVRAHINVTALAAPHLVKTKGNIVNVSSIAAHSIPEHASMIPYYVSKAAMHHFTKCAALELSRRGVRVNSVSPGPVKTDFLVNAGVTHIKLEDMSDSTPLQRVSESSEVADVILFLASNKAVGVTGSDYVVDNGFLVKA
ncbi:glucose 1-dehydrogenase-like [Colias croceus]|uniref:glucose 1-dehydrogenase-like n=1 Tax=Colias crocea TaxID=72248 RepID=UPI001E27AB5B|nr:glucose 1-dehydrogenase-like [Colias croceus]